MPKVANILLVYYATIIGPSCFSATEVGFVALEFVVIVQVKVSLCCIVIAFLFSIRKVSLILISLLTVS
jgi:hypothetical protein